jgi:hypothetical protein
MTAFQMTLAIVGGLLAAGLLEPPLRRVLALAAALIDTPLAEVGAVLVSARARLGHGREALSVAGFGLHALAGALPLAALATLILWADFTVTVATIQSWLPGDIADVHVVLFGRPLGLPETAALALTGLHVVFGALFMETVGLTRFLPLERLLARQGLRILRLVCVGVLIVLSGLSGALALWRTEQLRQRPLLAEAPASALVAGAGPLELGPDATQHLAALEDGWTDRLPAVAMPALAVILPGGGAVAAVGFYAATLAAGYTALALAELPLAVVGLLIQLLRTLVARLAAVAEGVLELLAAPLARLVAAGTAVLARYRRAT